MKRHEGDTPFYDVLICGGGLAGLSLARQVRLEQPERSVLLLDKAQGPAPDTTHKVGESTTEAGAFYLSQVLGLSSYFEEHHLFKLGFRFFFGHATEPLHKRPEFGISQFPSVPSFNVDRGVLENDLRRFAEEVGVEVREGSTIRSIHLGEGEQDHEVRYRTQPGGPTHVVKSRWVIDAMGRRRFLQKKLALQKQTHSVCNAVWFRVPGRVDLDDFVPAAEHAWHERVPGRIRFASTNHLMGTGYWTWVIPLSSGNTSIGIVAHEAMHPLKALSTYERAMEWLHTHEPQLASHVDGKTPLDFRSMKRYSYSSRQVFSDQRWACVGDAGLFADPLYAPGVDFIALANCMTTEMIRLDFAEALRPDFVQSCNQTIIALNDAMTHNIQLGYPLFGHPAVMAAKVIWDTAAGWALLAPQIFNSIYKDPELNTQVRKIKAGYYFLTRQMQQLFTEWTARSGGSCSFDFIDFLRIPVLRDLRTRNLEPGKSADVLVADHIRNMEQIEELAQAIFLVAVEDVVPDRLDELKQYDWLNAWRVSLDPSCWHDDGLFQPRTPKRKIHGMYEEVRSLFQFSHAMTPASPIS